MLQRLFPGRTADRLILRTTSLLDNEFGLPSAWASSVMIEWLDDASTDEGFTQAAKDAAAYAVQAGYAARMVEEADGTERQLDARLIARLAQIRVEAPARDRRELQEALEDPTATDLDRKLLKQLYDRGSDLPDDGGRDVLLALVLDDDPQPWFKSRRFLGLTGYSKDVWQIFVLKLTGVLKDQLAGERVFPWEAVEDLVRFGYVLRVGDALNGYAPPLFAEGEL